MGQHDNRDNSRNQGQHDKSHTSIAVGLGIRGENFAVGGAVSTGHAQGLHRPPSMNYHGLPPPNLHASPHHGSIGYGAHHGRAIVRTGFAFTIWGSTPPVQNHPIPTPVIPTDLAIRRLEPQDVEIFKDRLRPGATFTDVAAVAEKRRPDGMVEANLVYSREGLAKVHATEQQLMASSVATQYPEGPQRDIAVRNAVADMSAAQYTERLGNEALLNHFLRPPVQPIVPLRGRPIGVGPMPAYGHGPAPVNVRVGVGFRIK